MHVQTECCAAPWLCLSPEANTGLDSTCWIGFILDWIQHADHMSNIAGMLRPCITIRSDISAPVYIHP
eukprot:1159285-Pelagomonas_calceolata.AAC.2